MELYRAQHVQRIINGRQAAGIRRLVGAGMTPVNLVRITIDGEGNWPSAVGVYTGLDNGQNTTAKGPG